MDNTTNIKILGVKNVYKKSTEMKARNLISFIILCHSLMLKI